MTFSLGAVMLLLKSSKCFSDTIIIKTWGQGDIPVDIECEIDGNNVTVTVKFKMKNRGQYNSEKDIVAKILNWASRALFELWARLGAPIA